MCPFYRSAPYTGLRATVGSGQHKGTSLTGRKQPSQRMRRKPFHFLMPKRPMASSYAVHMIGTSYMCPLNT